MKTLDLRLEPESLGAVTIRLRLSGVQLEVQVEASHVQTMKLIRDDKDLLSAKLRSSGYAMDHLVVKLAEQQIGPAQTRAEAGQGHTFDGQSGNFTPSSELSQQGGSGANDRQAARRDQTTGFGKGDDAEDHARRGGDLYL
ncbi:flagellar hook-length control protein FliK [Methylocella silvestris]|nr:flagellar hook-length control protein FliK [Methylocella silvestris]